MPKEIPDEKKPDEEKITLRCLCCGKERQVSKKLLYQSQLTALAEGKRCFCQMCDPSKPGRPIGVKIWAKEWFILV